MKKILSVISTFLIICSASVYSQEYEDEFAEESDSFVKLYGSISAEGRSWINDDEIKSASKGSELDIEKKAVLNLNIEYSGSSSELKSDIKFDSSSIKNYPQDILNELTLKGFFGDGAVTLEAGKEKVMWGKTKTFRAINNFNAADYTDYLIPDYRERLISEPLFRMTITPGLDSDVFNNLKIEGIWTPMMTADRFASDGEWQSRSQIELNSSVQEILKYNISSKIAGGTPGSMTDSTAIVDSIMTTSNFTSEQLYSDNIKTLRYGQAGARITYSLLGVDFGFSYYYGHYKKPTLDLSPLKNGIAKAVNDYVQSSEGITAISTAYATDISTYTTQFTDYYNDVITAGETAALSPVTGNMIDLTDPSAVAEAVGFDSITATVSEHVEEIFFMTGKPYTLPSLNFDQLQVFGFETSFVIPGLGLNTNAEVAYNLTEDTKGDNPYIKNNSISWTAGIDRNLPLHHINIGLQTAGNFVLKNKLITDEDDTDYRENEKYITNKLIATLSDSFADGKVYAQCTGIYLLETKGILVMPQIDFECKEGFTISLSGAFIKSNDKSCEFYEITANDLNDKDWKAFVQVSGKYQF